jgi:predicted amino acid dehydrogenase
VSIFFLFRKESFKVVDSFRVNDRVYGYTILINNFGWHFLLKNRHEQIRQRILAATLFAQNELGVDVVGLGALTKDESLTQGGKWLYMQSGVNIPIIHGDTCTAWFVIKRLEELYLEHGARKPIAMIGPTSKIGRAVILHLAKKGFVFKAYTNSRERFVEIQKELPFEFQANVIHVTQLHDMQDCRVWVTGKNKPRANGLISFIPHGAAVLNFSVPDPLSEGVLRSRKDLCHVDGGLVLIPDTCDMSYMMRLKPFVTYACSGGTMAHAHQGWANSEVGNVQMNALESIGHDCEQMGLKLAPRSSHLKKI